MAIIGATQLEPVNVLGSYVQGMEMGRANQLAQQQAALALARNGLATCVKIGATSWLISGAGLS